MLTVPEGNKTPGASWEAGAGWSWGPKGGRSGLPPRVPRLGAPSLALSLSTPLSSECLPRPTGEDNTGSREVWGQLTCHSVSLACSQGRGVGFSEQVALKGDGEEVRDRMVSGETW